MRNIPHRTDGGLSMVKSRLLGAVGIVVVIGGMAGVLVAQTPESPAFEVASIKANPTDRYCLFDVLVPQHRVMIKACPLDRLILRAYGLDVAQLVMPDRTVSGSYDINATFLDRTP